ncbi:MAG: OsmC family protein [Balneolaceae bacterium]
MSTYSATIIWKRDNQPFIDNQYKRVHKWEFDGGETVRASSSPNVVPAPLSDPSAVDPEEAFIASISSCHMLWFLSIAAKRGFVADHYSDTSEGILAKDSNGRLSITEVTLRPHVIYDKNSSPEEKINIKMHQQAHKKCFIANSVKTEIKVESTIGRG